MKIKRIKVLKIACYDFDVIWNPKHNGARLNFSEHSIEIGTRGRDDCEIFMLICHELMELVAVISNVRMERPDCYTDYIFVYDHRQHDTMMILFAGALREFIV